MTILEAFINQVQMALIVSFYFYIRSYFIKEDVTWPDKPTIALICVIWFVGITALRYYYQMPMLGMYSCFAR